MTKNDALTLIKTLRNVVNDVPCDPTNWANEVCFHLDAASDVLEFGKGAPKPVFQGFHSFPTPSEVRPRGSFEVFHVNGEHDGRTDGELRKPGFYWWPCFPDCLPDGDPSGPFPTAEGAYLDAIGD